MMRKKKLKKMLEKRIAKNNEDKCNHDKCMLKKEVNGFCRECIQLPSKECNFCVTREMIMNKFPELIKD